MFILKLNFNEDNVNLYLIDDDEFITKVIKTKFETSTNYKVHTFITGEEFLENIIRNGMPKNSYSIVVLDYNLKTHKNYDAKNGIEILKTIKEIYPEIDVVMLSNIEDVDVVSSSMHYGAISFVKKNDNSFLRLSNIIKYGISQKKLDWNKRQSLYTKRLFMIIIILLVLFVLFFFKELFID